MNNKNYVQIPIERFEELIRKEKTLEIYNAYLEMKREEDEESETKSEEE